MLPQSEVLAHLSIEHDVIESRAETGEGKLFHKAFVTPDLIPEKQSSRNQQADQTEFPLPEARRVDRKLNVLGPRSSRPQPLARIALRINAVLNMIFFFISKRIVMYVRTYVG